ncbi:unnamed protein product [Mytilus edulis]|uniref:Uncharacterized protein n=1 Tax=Mytilus edulis TaxID=6550 RepID=A0A8S3PUZ4_MYTED|nr:unnamed protein product [Mytilus edulis]
MLECGLDPDAPLDNKGRTLTSVAIKRQSETFRPPEKENHTDLHLHPEIANGHEILCERSETENYTDFRQDKYACINILNGSLLKTEHMIVESNCDTIKIEVRTIGDGEMIVRYDFVCGPELIINGNFTMSSSSLITAAKMITTERSVFQNKRNHFRNKERNMSVENFG